MPPFFFGVVVLFLLFLRVHLQTITPSPMNTPPDNITAQPNSWQERISVRYVHEPTSYYSGIFRFNQNETKASYLFQKKITEPTLLMSMKEAKFSDFISVVIHHEFSSHNDMRLIIMLSAKNENGGPCRYDIGIGFIVTAKVPFLETEAVTLTQDKRFVQYAPSGKMVTPRSTYFVLGFSSVNLTTLITMDVSVDSFRLVVHPRDENPFWVSIMIVIIDTNCPVCEENSVSYYIQLLRFMEAQNSPDYIQKVPGFEYFAGANRFLRGGSIMRWDDSINKWILQSITKADAIMLKLPMAYNRRVATAKSVKLANHLLSLAGIMLVFSMMC